MEDIFGMHVEHSLEITSRIFLYPTEKVKARIRRVFLLLDLNRLVSIMMENCSVARVDSMNFQ